METQQEMVKVYFPILKVGRILQTYKNVDMNITPS